MHYSDEEVPISKLLLKSQGFDKLEEAIEYRETLNDQEFDHYAEENFLWYVYYNYNPSKGIIARL